MAVADDGRLRRLLGDPELAWLLERIRRRLELGRDLDGTVALRHASPSQRQALRRLLGRPARPGETLTVSLPALDAVLRRSGACRDGLAAAVIALTGEVTVRAEIAAVRARAWTEAFRPLTETVAQRPELAGWLEQLWASGVVKRMAPQPAEASELLERLAAVIAGLPGGGEPVARFASRRAGGAHELDDGRPLATLALGAARTLGGLPACGELESEAEWRREVWAAVGLLRDELSSTVLTLGLPSEPASGTGRMLQVAGESGQPVWLTLRQLVRDAPRWDRLSVVVHVCEGPSVVAVAADQLGAACAPLVCTGGQPGAAVMVLLRALCASGARLRHHGDFDWGGLRIGNLLHTRLEIEPWRFGADSFASAARLGYGPALSGHRVEACWDPRLASLMSDAGRRIEEEQVLDELIGDLST